MRSGYDVSNGCVIKEDEYGDWEVVGEADDPLTYCNSDADSEYLGAYEGNTAAMWGND
jgi:hypothetical protein